jgi:hypothetical protein
MNEYVICKIGWRMKLAQRELLQSLNYEFALPDEILSSPRSSR